MTRLERDCRQRADSKELVAEPDGFTKRSPWHDKTWCVSGKGNALSKEANEDNDRSTLSELCLSFGVYTHGDVELDMKTIGTLATILILFCTAMGAQAQSQNQAAPWNLRYTISEYNALQAAAREKTPEKQIESLDRFVSEYPSSDLLVYVYPLYYTAYSQLRNFPKVFEYADKLIALGGRVPAATHYAALCFWAAAYNSSNSSDAGLAAKARERALAGLKLIPSLERPSGMDKKTFEEEKKRGAVHLYLTAAAADLVMKDYVAVNERIKELQALNIYDPRPLIEPKPSATGF